MCINIILIMNNNNPNDFAVVPQISLEYFESEVGNVNTRSDMLQLLYAHYPNEYYLKYPDFCIKKLCLDKNTLNSLNDNYNERTREEVNNWFNNSSLTIEAFIYCGY
jgi:hypothetical protein